MKKLLAVLLAFALLVPMGLVANADNQVTAEPYYLLGWSDYNRDKFPYLEGLAGSSFSNIGDKVILSFGGARMMYGSYTDADVTKFAQAMKKEMDSRPEGMRYWHVYGPGIALRLAPKNAIYLDHGVDQMKDLLTAALKKMKEIGCPLEGIVVDTEYIDMGSWYIQGDEAKKDPLIYNKIVNDPRYATEVRPLLVERGFKFYENITNLTPEIYGIHNSTGDEYAVSRSVWDTVMRLRLMDHLNEWCYEPMITNYPDATLSDYQSTDTYAWLKGVNDAGNVVGSVGGNTSKAGNVSNYNFYANRPSSVFFKDSGGLKVFKTPPTYNGAVYEASAFNMFMYDANLVKRMYCSTDTKMLSFWLSEYDYDTKEPGTLSNTPYYAEEILHLGLYDPQPFLGYLYSQSFKDENGKVSVEEYEKRCVVLNELMAELTRVAGYSDRKPIELPMNWNSEFVLSGMYVNGKNLWRITPNTDVVSAQAFQVAGKDPTFSVAGQTVTFPGGKIIEDGKISVVGTCGYWVETAKDVIPIVTNDADRFVQVPAYVEDFESYKVGTQLTTMNIRDENGWTVMQPKGNPITVEADGENQLISMTGNAALKNKQIPANVTAADSFAKEQHWSLTVTVPAGMTEEEAFVVLDYAGDKQETKDGGYKLSGGKVYYSDNGQYKELALDVSAGGKYVFTRALNFSTNTCDYVVTDTSGKEVASAKNVAIAAFTGKISTIGITCTKVAGKILVDDYTLRVTGAAADFGVYDAATGLKVSAETPHAASAAYRLSWLNATDKEETATIVAEYYEGSTLKETKTVKELKLAPGYDGVETGVLEVAAGQSVKVYVKSALQVNVEQGAAIAPTTPADPTAPTTDPVTDPTTAPTGTAPTNSADSGKQSGGNTMVIILIAVAVVAVVAIVVALVVTKPKKKAE